MNFTTIVKRYTLVIFFIFSLFNSSLEGAILAPTRFNYQAPDEGFSSNTHFIILITDVLGNRVFFSVVEKGKKVQSNEIFTGIWYVYDVQISITTDNPDERRRFIQSNQGSFFISKYTKNFTHHLTRNSERSISSIILTP